jgi:hypothetical protein
MMRKRLTLSVLACLIVIFGMMSSTVVAQDEFTEDDAIALAAASPAFAEALAERDGWSAAAYNTHNRYGVWRVQFWDQYGEDMGYADVSPMLGQVFFTETYYGATEAQRQRGQDVVREFVENSPEVWALIDDPSQYDMYIDYEGWMDAWGVYIDLGADSVYVAVQFDDIIPSALENPRILALGFPTVGSYDEWYAATEDQAIGIAFQQPEIAAAVRGNDAWYAAATPVEGENGDLWAVGFYLGDQLVATATVDVLNGAITGFSA